jgi:HAD superfamily hydrolase (TIGR01509 family)
MDVTAMTETRGPRALLFDMDGTLTEPYLDFAGIRAEIGVGDRPLLEAMAEISPAQRAAAETILHRHEDKAAAESVLNPGCTELLAYVRERRFGTALITRNSRRSVASVLQKHALHFDVLVTREDANGKFKPDPYPLLHACEALGVEPAVAWMIGDARYDVEAGTAAGTRTVWLSHGQPKGFSADPWRTVRDLHELLQLLRDAARCPSPAPE